MVIVMLSIYTQRLNGFEFAMLNILTFLADLFGFKFILLLTACISIEFEIHMMNFAQTLKK